MPFECKKICEQRGLLVGEQIDGVLFVEEGCRHACFGQAAANALTAGALDDRAIRRGTPKEEGFRPITTSYAGLEDQRGETTDTKKEGKNQGIQGQEHSDQLQDIAMDDRALQADRQGQKRKDDVGMSTDTTRMRLEISKRLRADLNGSVDSAKIRAYVKNAKMVESDSTNSTQRRIMQEEIKRQVRDMLQKQANVSDGLNMSDFRYLGQKISFAAHQINAGNLSIDASRKQIFATIKNRHVQIEQTARGVRLKDGDYSVELDGLEVDGEEVYVDGKRLGLMPEDAASRVEGKVTDIKIAQREDRNIYQFKTKSRARFLGLFDIEIDKDVELDAEDGEKIAENRPWWSFLAFEVE